MTTRAERKAAKSLLRIRGLYAWGSSEYGQLGTITRFILLDFAITNPRLANSTVFESTGLGPEVKERSVPTQVFGFENTLQLAASGSHSLVLKSTH